MQGNRFEVVCRRCQVTFPPGIRRCMHCGGRTESSPDPSSARPGVREVADAPYSIAPVGATEPAPATAPEPQPHEWDDEEQEADAPSGAPSSKKAKGAALVWIALALMGILARACEG